MTAPLDDFDRKILALVQQDNQLTITEIGERVGLSKSAVQRRLAALHLDGRILADVAVPNPNRLGPFLGFVLSVTLKSDRPDTMSRFAQAARARTEVQQCYHVTGPTDFVLIVNVTDQAHFDELTRELLYDNQDIERFESSLIVERTKIGLTLPIAR